MLRGRVIGIVERKGLDRPAARVLGPLFALLLTPLPTVAVATYHPIPYLALGNSFIFNSALSVMFAMCDAFGVLLLLPPLLTVHAQSTSPTIVCIAGQCIQGYTNATLGATITSGNTSLLLLPGLYTSTTNPQLLHDTLTSSSASLSPFPGFSDSSTSNTGGSTTSTRPSLPLSISLQPGLAFYANKLYAGQVGLAALPTVPIPQTLNDSIPITASAMLLSSNVFTSLVIGAANSNNNNNRVIMWDSVPDILQLPSRLAQSALSLLDVQSTTCSTLNGGCSSAGVCTPSTSTSTTSAGQCQCLPNFTGSSCESCAAGFFGLSCTPCATGNGCAKCDDGISGSGRCLEKSLGAGDPKGCNCASGVCGSDGVSCTCTNGFDASAGTGQQCSTCKAGFFRDADGGCKICQIGCSSCADLTGECTSCQPQFTKNPTDDTKCDPPQGVTTSSQLCPDGSFPNGASCAVCASECETCTGPSGCVRCKTGLYTLNGACVSANTVGVCAGTDLLADNSKKECDSCGAKCLKCEIPNFTTASIASLAQCTQCLPGSFLSNGKCVDTCPSGTTPSDNSACIPCDSSCSTCSGSPIFCLTCPNNQLAFNGKCVSSCPTNTFTSSSSAGQCLSCHPDCASCSGAAFNQCTSCPSARPVLASSGRCLSACEAKNQFFDPTSTPGACRQCAAGCATCSGPSSSECLSCSGENTLVGGSCTPATCDSGTNVVSGLGLCLAPDLVLTRAPGNGDGGAPLPPVDGINTTTIVKKGLEWWKILLMVLGCVFIFCFVVWCLCRRKKKRKAKGQQQIMVMGNIGKGDGYGDGEEMPKFDKKRSVLWHVLDWFQSLFGFGYNAKRRRERKRTMEETYGPYEYAHAPEYFIPTYTDRAPSRSLSQSHSYSNSSSNLNSMKKASLESPPPRRPTPPPVIPSPPPSPPAFTDTGKSNWIWSVFGRSPSPSTPPEGLKIVHLGPLNTNEHDFNNYNNSHNNDYYGSINAELEREKAVEKAKDKAAEEPSYEEEFDSEAVMPAVSMPLPKRSSRETVDMIHLIESYNRPLTQVIPPLPTTKNKVSAPWRPVSPLPPTAPTYSSSGLRSGNGSRNNHYACETNLRPGARAPPPSVPASVFASDDEDDDAEFYSNYDYHTLDKRSSLRSDAYTDTDNTPRSTSHEHYYIPAPLPSPSIYSQFTARPNLNSRNHGGINSRRLPEPRVPLMKDVGRRFDASEFGRGSTTRRVGDPF